MAAEPRLTIRLDLRELEPDKQKPAADRFDNLLGKLLSCVAVAGPAGANIDGLRAFRNDIFLEGGVCRIELSPKMELFAHGAYAADGTPSPAIQSAQAKLPFFSALALKASQALLPPEAKQQAFLAANLRAQANMAQAAQKTLEETLLPALKSAAARAGMPFEISFGGEPDCAPAPGAKAPKACA